MRKDSMSRPFRPRVRGYIKKCTYTSTDENSCMKKAHLDGDKCVYHSKFLVEEQPKKGRDDIPSYNTECPICLEKIKRFELVHKNICGHAYHVECMKGLNKLECPTCRSELIDLPDNILDAIQDNMDFSLYPDDDTYILDEQDEIGLSFNGNTLNLNAVDLINTMINQHPSYREVFNQGEQDTNELIRSMIPTAMNIISNIFGNR